MVVPRLRVAKPHDQDSDRRYNSLVIFELNYDSQKAEWRSLNVRKQATLIAYKGRRELSRIEFKTDKAQINALLASTIS